MWTEIIHHSKIIEVGFIDQVISIVFMVSALAVFFTIGYFVGKISYDKQKRTGKTVA